VFQDRATAQENAERFVRRVVESGDVWGLESDDGWAVCPSTESGDDEGIQVMPFWSDRAYAQRAANRFWEGYTPTAIPLARFLERWLAGRSTWPSG
jgi:hypothetical protein